MYAEIITMSLIKVPISGRMEKITHFYGSEVCVFRILNLSRWLQFQSGEPGIVCVDTCILHGLLIHVYCTDR